jgi:hypothetical protein
MTSDKLLADEHCTCPLTPFADDPYYQCAACERRLEQGQEEEKMANGDYSRLSYMAEGLENMAGVHSNQMPHLGDDILIAAAQELRRRQQALRARSQEGSSNER